MLHAPTDLYRSQQLLQDADRLMATADARLAQSHALIACGSSSR